MGVLEWKNVQAAFWYSLSVFIFSSGSLMFVYPGISTMDFMSYYNILHSIFTSFVISVISFGGSLALQVKAKMEEKGRGGLLYTPDKLDDFGNLNKSKKDSRGGRGEKKTRRKKFVSQKGFWCFVSESVHLFSDFDR